MFGLLICTTVLVLFIFFYFFLIFFFLHLYIIHYCLINFYLPFTLNLKTKQFRFFLYLIFLNPSEEILNDRIRKKKKRKNNQRHDRDMNFIYWLKIIIFNGSLLILCSTYYTQEKVKQ